MTREAATAIVIAFAVLVFAAMFWGWRRRARRDARLVAPTDVPALAADAAASVFDGFYVATTAHDAPLDRLAMRHLAFRGRLRALVRPDGVALEIPGEPTVFLATATLQGVGLATWTIDRVVERDGLVLLAWRADSGETVDSYLRFADDADAFVAAVLTLIPTPAPTTGSDA